MFFLPHKRFIVTSKSSGVLTQESDEKTFDSRVKGSPDGYPKLVRPKKKAHILFKNK